MAELYVVLVCSLLIQIILINWLLILMDCSIFQVLAHPQPSLPTLSHPGVLEVLLGQMPDQRGALLINSLLNHAGTVFVMAIL